MSTAILHLGSNMGAHLKNIQLAQYYIEQYVGEVLKASSLYETEPWGRKEQDNFINVVYLVETILEPDELLHQLQRIEKKLGRLRIEKWGSRTMDIDILFYDSLHLENDHLKIPHPEITNRNFVLQPLNEILPDMKHPVLDKTISQLHEECEDKSGVHLY